MALMAKVFRRHDGSRMVIPGCWFDNVQNDMAEVSKAAVRTAYMIKILHLELEDGWLELPHDNKGVHFSYRLTMVTGPGLPDGGIKACVISGPIYESAGTQTFMDVIDEEKGTIEGGRMQ